MFGLADVSNSRTDPGRGAYQQVNAHTVRFQERKGNPMTMLSTTTRRIVRAASALAVGGLVFAMAPAAGAAAGNATPILVVHGFDADQNNSIDCKDAVMTAWVNGLRSRGFTNVQTVGWYRGDVNCYLRVPGIADNTVDTSLDQVGREFATLVANRFGATTVAVSAHSMGGLVVRRALDGVHNGHSDFPSNIRVSDVVTAGTPHGGTPAGNLCSGTQCLQVRSGSPFLQALEPNPQTPGTTDWTLIGSDCDIVASAASATNMARVSTNRPSVFKRVFAAPFACVGGVSHDGLVTTAAGLQAINDGLRTGN